MTIFKCIPVEHGVDISYSGSFFFTFKNKTHNLIDVGGGNVRISRKIDGIVEILASPYTSFVNLSGVPVANTFSELFEYMNQDVADLKAGEGISVTNDTVSIVSGGPSTLGGFKVGTGLSVDGSGRLSANAVSEVTKVLATEAEMLGLQTEELRPYRIIRLDTKRLYYLNAGVSPSVLSNWFTGPSLETTVLSFNGRTGVVGSEYGDYNFDLIPLTDKTTNASHKFVIDNDELFIETIDGLLRTKIAYAKDFDLASIQTQLSSLDDVVNSPSNGLVKKVSDLKTTSTRLDDIVTNATTGLVSRIEKIESQGPATDYSSEIQALKDKDASNEQLILSVNNKVDSTAANTVVLDQRVSELELNGGGTNYGPQISALEAEDIAQDSRISSLEGGVLTKADLINGKVPYEQLPEFPVGRKVNVANKAARLALPAFGDLTIAYESDTADAWGLDANDDPAIEANWSKLGNTQAVGVLSFNGRTGAIGAQVGDYNTGQITELIEKRFVSTEQIAKWDAVAGAGVTSFKGRSGEVKPLQGDYNSEMINESTSKQFISASEKSLITTIDARLKLLESEASYVRTWKSYSITSERVQGIWYVNTNPREIIVDAQSNNISNFVFLRLEMKANETAPVFNLNSNNANGSISFTAKVMGHIPAGWMYRITDNAGGNVRVVARWVEFS